MKIKAEELRYGNLLNRVFDSPKSNIDKEAVRIGSVNGLSNIYYCFDENIGSLEELEPIRLSSLWLVDLGYKDLGTVIVAKNNKFRRFVLHNCNHEVHIIESNNMGKKHITYATSIGMNERQYNKRLEFVHDLQNAVYKETGVDLALH